MPNEQSASSKIEFPYTVERVVSWGDCDPSGFIYMPRAFDYAVELLDNWFVDVVGTSWAEMVAGGNGFPTVRTECEFLKALMVNTPIRLTMTVERVGSASLGVVIDAHARDGTHHFRVNQVNCYITMDPVKPVPIRDDYRERIEAYYHACQIA